MSKKLMGAGYWKDRPDKNDDVENAFLNGWVHMSGKHDAQRRFS